VLYDEQGASRRGHRQHGRGQGRRAHRRASSSAWNCCGKYTVFAEGARGHLGKQLLARYKLDAGKRPAELRHRHQGAVGGPPDKAQPGLVVHTAGWPMADHTFGGGFLYHLEGNKVTLGFVDRPRLQPTRG
jgi:electron-transferring-flavoprotein dehydrogenase